MLLCLHEEAAVAIAHGYAKVTGKAMAAAVHSNVGLFHATMAIFNAWCDRMPVHRSRRHRAGRCRQAAAVDRLDPHRRRPGRHRAPLHQVGRPARLPGRGARIAAARHVAGQCRAAGPGLHQSRRGDAGGGAGEAAAAAIDAKRYMPPVVNAAPGRPHQAGRRVAQGRQASGDPRRPRVPRSQPPGSSGSRSPRRSAPG